MSSCFWSCFCFSACTFLSSCLRFLSSCFWRFSSSSLRSLSRSSLFFSRAEYAPTDPTNSGSLQQQKKKKKKKKMRVQNEAASRREGRWSSYSASLPSLEGEWVFMVAAAGACVTFHLLLFLGLLRFLRRCQDFREHQGDTATKEPSRGIIIIINEIRMRRRSRRKRGSYVVVWMPGVMPPDLSPWPSTPQVVSF